MARKFRRDSIEHKVLRLMEDGMEPSRIDRELRLPRGTAHDIVVDHWYTDKERGLSLIDGPLDR